MSYAADGPTTPSELGDRAFVVSETALIGEKSYSGLKSYWGPEPMKIVDFVFLKIFHIIGELSSKKTSTEPIILKVETLFPMDLKTSFLQS